MPNEFPAEPRGFSTQQLLALAVGITLGFAATGIGLHLRASGSMASLEAFGALLGGFVTGTTIVFAALQIEMAREQRVREEADRTRVRIMDLVRLTVERNETLCYWSGPIQPMLGDDIEPPISRCGLDSLDESLKRQTHGLRVGGMENRKARYEIFTRLSELKRALDLSDIVRADVEKHKPTLGDDVYNLLKKLLEFSEARQYYDERLDTIRDCEARTRKLAENLVADELLSAEGHLLRLYDAGFVVFQEEYRSGICGTLELHPFESVEPALPIDGGRNVDVAKFLEAACKRFDLR